jgi:hypothetical protein
MTWIYILLAFIAGGWFGMAVMALFQVNRRDDDD